MKSAPRKKLQGKPRRKSREELRARKVWSGCHFKTPQEHVLFWQQQRLSEFSQEQLEMGINQRLPIPLDTAVVTLLSGERDRRKARGLWAAKAPAVEIASPPSAPVDAPCIRVGDQAVPLDCKFSLVTMSKKAFDYFIDRLVEGMKARGVPIPSRAEWEKQEGRWCIDGDYNAYLHAYYFRMPALARIIDYYYAHPEMTPTPEKLVKPFGIEGGVIQTDRLSGPEDKATLEEERKLLASSFIEALDATRIWEHKTSELCGRVLAQSIVDKKLVVIPEGWERRPTKTKKFTAALFDVDCRTITNWVNEGKLQSAGKKGAILTASIQKLLELKKQ